MFLNSSNDFEGDVFWISDRWVWKLHTLRAIYFWVLSKKKRANLRSHEIRVAVAGAGSALSGMVQAISLYKKGDGRGLLHPVLGEYSPSDVEIVAVFDVDKRKVGKTLKQALFVEQSALPKYTEVEFDTKVLPGVLKDERLQGRLEVETSDEQTVTQEIERSGAQILLNVINGGMYASSEAYARCALKAGVAFVNATPTPIATSLELEALFSRNKLPLLGDDLLSQIGGTILHTFLLWFLNSRGVWVKQTYQLDVGGGLENLLTVEDDELKLTKRTIKSSTVSSVLPYQANIATGTTEYVDFMGNSRESHFEIVGSYTLGAPLEIELTLRTQDGANAAGPLLDAIRAAKVALDRGIGGALEEVNPYLFKLVRSKVDPISAEKNFIKFFEEN